MNNRHIRSAILTACALRGSEASVCPSEIARTLNPDHWRALMERVRAAAAALARDGRIRITQRGVDVDPDGVHGPIRLKAPRHQQP